MESKFHSFWTKSKCRLKNFVAALNQFSQFVQCVQIVGARVFEVMFSVTTVCLVQGRSHFPFLLHQWRSLKPPPPRLYPVFISIPIPQAAAPGPRSNRRKKPPRRRRAADNTFFGSFPTYIGHTYLTYAFYACHTRGRKGRPVKQRGDALTLGTSNCQRCSPAVSQQIVLTIIMFADNDVFIIITANVTPA